MSNLAVKDATNPIFTELLEQLDIPASYYEAATNRYRSIGEWLHRPASKIAELSPVVSPQGSFALGLVNKPANQREEYDLDLVCLLAGHDKHTVTQKDLKELLGSELELYRASKQILEPLQERKRCWRLDYADSVRFHVDVLPCIREESDAIAALIASGVPAEYAEHAIALTCKTDPNFSRLTTEWPTSNPTGFRMWFEARMGIAAQDARSQLYASGSYRSIDEVPTYSLKTPLQQSLQILKRHRDWMFRAKPALKPISMILTTLGAHAYDYEAEVSEAVLGLLERMPQYVAPSDIRIANPVNPGEDFADKWRSNPALEKSFNEWREQALRDFSIIIHGADEQLTKQIAERSLGVTGFSSDKQKSSSRPLIRVTDGPKPWRKDR